MEKLIYNKSLYSFTTKGFFVKKFVNTFVKNCLIIEVIIEKYYINQELMISSKKRIEIINIFKKAKLRCKL